MSSYYPVFLDLNNKICVVVGGGSVAERKVRMLLEHKASVTVISPKLNRGLQKLADLGDIQVTLRTFKKSDLKGALIAVAATNDSEINAAVAEQGRKQHVLINVVDNPSISDFIVPSIVKRGDIAIAISTGGNSPALARKLRTELDATLPAEYANLVSLVSEVRQEMIRRQASVSNKSWQKCLKLDILTEMIRKGQLEKARKKLVRDLLSAENSI